MSIGGIGGFDSSSMMRQVQQRMFQKADADGSGGVSLDEMNSALGSEEARGARPDSATMEKMFSSMDADGDGQLTSSEMRPPSFGGAHLSEQTLSTLVGLQTGGGQTEGSSQDFVLQLLNELGAATEDDESAQSDDFSSASESSSTAFDPYKVLLESLDSEDTRGRAESVTA